MGMFLGATWSSVFHSLLRSVRKLCERSEKALWVEKFNSEGVIYIRPELSVAKMAICTPSVKGWNSFGVSRSVFFLLLLSVNLYRCWTVFGTPDISYHSENTKLMCLSVITCGWSCSLWPVCNLLRKVRSADKHPLPFPHPGALWRCK